MAIIPGAVGQPSQTPPNVDLNAITVTISLEMSSLTGSSNYTQFHSPLSATFVRPPAYPLTNNAIAQGGSTSFTGTGQVPSAGGSVATGTGQVPAATGVTVVAAGTVVGSSPTPTNVPPLPRSLAVNPGLGFTVRVMTNFGGKPEAEVGATAVLFSEIGSPSWANRSVPVNGYFTLTPSEITNGDIVKVRVTPGSNLDVLSTTTSNGIDFEVAPGTFATTGLIGNRSDTYTLTPFLANSTHIYFASVHQVPTAAKLYRVSLSTFVAEQVCSLTSPQGATDSTSVLAIFNNNCYFSSTSTANTGLKMYKADASNNITWISNTRNSLANPDTITNVGLPAYGESISQVTPLIFNNFYYFSANNSGTSNKLYKMSTGDVITQVSNTRNNQVLADSPTNFVIFNGALYGTLNNASGGAKLHKITTADVITLLSDTRNAPTVSDSIQILGQTANNLYFRASNSTGVDKLFRINTSDVITQVSQIGTASEGDGISARGAVFGGNFYFAARAQGITTGSRLYCYEEANDRLVQVTNLTGGPTSVASDAVVATSIKATADAVYFMGTGGFSGGVKLFKVGASPYVVRQACTLSPGAAEAFGYMFTLNSVNYLFGPSVGTGAFKLFRLDGEQAVQLSNFHFNADTDISVLPVITGGSIYFIGTVMNQTKLMKFTP